MIRHTYIQDIIEEIVDAMTVDCYFQFGYWPEVSVILQDLGQSKTGLQNTRYPFIMLSAGWREQKETELGIYAEIRDLQLYIVAESQKNYSTAQREELVFQPVIMPIYDQLIEGLKNHVALEVPFNEFPHEIQKLYYLRNMEANQNQLRNYVEVLQVSPELLRVHYDYVCQ